MVRNLLNCECVPKKDRELWVVKLTTATELPGVPNIKIVGNIHGNEPVGKEIILHLIQVSHTCKIQTSCVILIIFQITANIHEYKYNSNLNPFLT